jgi:hypothetical protein
MSGCELNLRIGNVAAIILIAKLNQHKTIHSLGVNYLNVVF